MKQITLETLPHSTPQQVFNQVKRHLLKQNETCVSEDDEACKYRHGSLKCAAGCLISDEEYKPEFENNDWEGLITKFNITRCHENLIKDLQNVHDDTLPEEWKSELERLAKKYQLKWK